LEFSITVIIHPSAAFISGNVAHMKE